jgi:D-alanyl-D-alanine carboxypeptidase
MSIVRCLFFITISPALFFAVACTKPAAGQGEGGAATRALDMTPVTASGAARAEDGVPAPVQAALDGAGIPENLRQKIRLSVSDNTSFADNTSVSGDSSFLSDLSAVTEGDPFLRRLVDKQHALPEGYEPDDLVELRGGKYQVSRAGLQLRRDAADALGEMAEAARADVVTLVASSAYRSRRYQVTVYQRIVAEMGQEAADRESSRPGYSQHQTGLAVDFGSISDEFADTKAGRWLAANAARYGWSLSFPDGYEALTGYRWESWHYRYVGPALAAFIDAWFGGIQQYALQFINEWEKQDD